MIMDGGTTCSLDLRSNCQSTLLVRKAPEKQISEINYRTNLGAPLVARETAVPAQGATKTAAEGLTEI